MLTLKVSFNMNLIKFKMITNILKCSKLLRIKIHYMIKFQDIKVGDYLMADNDGDSLEGEVINLNGDEKQVCVNTGTQEFWFETEQLQGIPLDDAQLEKLKFTKQINLDGTIKYMKGAFRMMLTAKDNFLTTEIWYRDEKRHITQPLSVHQLQNHYYEMTKVHLTNNSFV